MDDLDNLTMVVCPTLKFSEISRHFCFDVHVSDNDLWTANTTEILGNDRSFQSYKNAISSAEEIGFFLMFGYGKLQWSRIFPSFNLMTICVLWQDNCLPSENFKTLDDFFSRGITNLVLDATKFKQVCESVIIVHFINHCFNFITNCFNFISEASFQIKCFSKFRAQFFWVT